MVLIEEFSESLKAREAQEFLLNLGIKSTLAVDPLSSRAPALGHFQELGLFVEKKQADKALFLLRSRHPEKRLATG